MDQNTPSKQLLIDASHHEEMRVALIKDGRLEDFVVETADKVQNKGNIYVATISRVEPSLQAAFVTYGGERNGFLAFGEVNPEYFEIPAKEKKALLQELAEVAERRKNRHKQNHEDELPDPVDAMEDGKSHAEISEEEPATKRTSLFKRISSSIEAVTGGGSSNKEEAIVEEPEERKPPIHRRYKIENVLKEGQKILVQVVKEERGNKGAALTTYFALPGRFTVLMPNTPHAGGISRKISDYEDRQELKEVYGQLDIPDEMGLIIRTAGVGQGAKAIQKDFKNLSALWKGIQKDFKRTNDIKCIHEDGSIVIRTLRDMLQEDIDSLVISGKATYKQAKDYMKTLMPDVASITKEHKEDTPLFVHYGVEEKLNRLHHTRVDLPSGGYLIINPTEALVAVDVNSGRNTAQKNVEETAFQTNMEAADEVARQMRLRDLAGLIVVDFIDMEDYKHNRSVERAMRKAIRRDRARTQVGNISNFGLMEISRQRLRPSFGESHFKECPHCNGTGLVHTESASALMLLRRLEESDARDADKVVLHTSTDAVVYILNHKRGLIQEMEAKYKYQIMLRPDEKFIAPDHKLDLITMKADGSEKTTTVEMSYKQESEETASQQRKRGGKNNKSSNDRKGQRKPARNTKQQNTKKDDSASEKPVETKTTKNSEKIESKEKTPQTSKEDSSTTKKKEVKSSNSGGQKDTARKTAPTRVSAEKVQDHEKNTETKLEKAEKANDSVETTPTSSEKPKKSAKTSSKPKTTTKKAKDKPVSSTTIEADMSEVKIAPKAKTKMKVSRVEHKEAPSKPVMLESFDTDGNTEGLTEAPQAFERWWSKS